MRGPQQLACDASASSAAVARHLLTAPCVYASRRSSRGVVCAVCGVGSRYYPRDWWHNTRNEAGENIAITGTVADGLNFDSISEELARDVKRENPIIMSPSPALTAALPGCYQWLRDAYGGGLQ